ncbi:hypothetical protein AB0M95_21025 [Sphaerisporangium sp. NPDC051017]|uniref:hypothetical protein n=1 Tax=Sphaerisporangium sp. NPDC051017 TaxID=3154636 RepID=UPI0034201839
MVMKQGPVSRSLPAPIPQWRAPARQGDRIKRNRKEIREAYGFRANTEKDQERPAGHAGGTTE